MKNIAVIEIGSNSMKVVVYQIYENNCFKIIDEAKRMARLGQHIDDYDNLSHEGINQLMIALEYFRIFCKKNNVMEISVVATEAIRRAKNKDIILSLVKEITGLNIRILNGLEEAAYGYITIQSTMNIRDALLVDIGGSSMEITLIKDKKIINGISLPFGSIPLTKLFPFDSTQGKYLKSDFRKFIFSEFDKSPWLRNVQNLPLIGIGGTTRSIGKIHKEFTAYPLDLLHNYSISFGEIKNLYNYVLNLNYSQKLSLKGLPKERADIFTAPFSALIMLMDYCHCPLLKISQYGLREGVLYEKLFGQNINNIDILEFSLNNILTNNDLDIAHADKIRDLSYILFEHLGNSSSHFYKLENKLLGVAAKLHDINVNVSKSHSYKQSFYLIIDSLISGLTHNEILMVSYTISLIGEFDYKLADKYSILLTSEESYICKRLSIILYLAHKIDKYFYNRLNEIVTIDENDDLKLALPENNLPIKMYNNFKEYFDKKLYIAEL